MYVLFYVSFVFRQGGSVCVYVLFYVSCFVFGGSVCASLCVYNYVCELGSVCMFYSM